MMTLPRPTAVLIVMVLNFATAAAAEKETRLFELRTYYAAEGKLDALHARFRDHTLKLFERHGITNVGYWTPIENPDRRLIYVVAHRDAAARGESFRKFLADPDWQQAHRESERNGKLVDKIESVLMQATDYSPPIKLAKSGDRVFELRTYTATPGNLDRLHGRFRNHTLKLFEKHGMTNVAYWGLAKDQKGVDNTLIYILAHQSVDAAKASFTAFRQDPDWLAAKAASEKEGGGSLTTKDGVQSLFMKATDYSPIQ